MNEKVLKVTLRITALFLWYFVLLFLFIVLDMNMSTPFLKEGTFIGDMMIRYPYQWDYELMFAGLFLVWGIFLWKASKKLSENKMVIQFTAWAFLAHAVSMIIVGLIRSSAFTHLVTDSILWFLISFLIFYLSREKPTISLERLAELQRAAFVASTGASTRLAGSKLSDEQVAQISKSSEQK